MSVTSIVLPSLSSKLFFPTVSPLAVDLRGLIVFTMPTRVSLCSYLFFMQCRYFVYFLRFAMPVGCFCNEMFNQMANCSMKYFSRSYNPRLLMCQVSTIHVCLCVRCIVAHQCKSCRSSAWWECHCRVETSSMSPDELYIWLCRRVQKVNWN